MGLNLPDRIDRIFAREGNFDISGFFNAELMTADFVKALSRMSREDREELLRRGYGFSWFKTNTSDGIIWKRVNHGKLHYTLKIYFNSQYAKEIENMKMILEEDKEA